MSNYVIIGGSAAGISCCEAIREQDKKGSITLISDETLSLYSRCLLTYLISGRLDEKGLIFKDKDFYKINGIEALHGVRATRINIKDKRVELENNKKIQFKKLLIATGSSPMRLSIPGEEKKGVFNLRKIEDALGVISMLDDVETAVILGGGLIGLRNAYALRLREKKIKVIVKSPQILSQMLDKEGADIVERKFLENGIEIMKGLQAKEILGKEGVEGLILENGTKIPCQMVIIGKGVNPNLDIVKGTEIRVNYGIIVDEHLMTSVKDIYAAGDVAEAYDITTNDTRINAVWPVAVEEGRVSGLNMAGKAIIYDGSNMMNSTDFFELATISMGVTKPKTPDYEALVFMDKENKIYKKIVLKDNVICGLILVNRVSNAGVYGILMKKRVDIASIKGQLLKDNFDYAKILPIVKGLPDKFSSEEFKHTAITL